jgi:hypothetical protein
MHTIYTLTFIGLFIWIPWLWRYQIQSRLKRHAVRAELSGHPEKERYLNTEKLLFKIYRPNKLSLATIKAFVTSHIRHIDFTYGEIEFLSFMMLLEKANPQPHEIFVDLGCGAGKAVLTAALGFNFSKVVGIELLPHLCVKAKDRIKRAYNLLESSQPMNQYVKQLNKIEIINDNFNRYNIAQCHVLFINATCFCAKTWTEILDRLTYLNAGTRVILTSRTLPKSHFRLLFQGRTLMSWGMNSVSIYEKVSP